MKPIAYSDVFSSRYPVLGVIHLLPLPGAPLFEGDINRIYEKALSEAASYEKAGLDGIVVENFRDAPFYPEQVPAETVAAMSAVVREVVNAVDMPIGVNVLRNDAHAAMAVAAATGAHFVRVNVHTGAVLADQGVIQGRAWHTLRLRAQLKAKTLIFADVGVKHAVPLAPYGLEYETRDLSERSLADGVIVSGSGTGKATSTADLELVRNNTELPVWIGSGTTPETLPGLAKHANGFIVGSHFKKDGNVLNDVEPSRIESLLEIARNLS